MKVPPQISERQPFNLQNPESAGKIICSSSRLRNSRCWERGCKRAGSSPINFPTNKIFLPKILGSGPMFSNRCRFLRPAQLKRFPVTKTAGRGQEDFIGRKIFQAADRRDQQLETCSSCSAKKCEVKDEGASADF